MPIKAISTIIILCSFALSFITKDWTKAFAGLIIVLLVERGNKQQKLFNPYYLLIATVLSFLLYYAPIGGVYTSPLMFSTQVLIVLCLVAVYLGFRYCEGKDIKTIVCGDYTENYWLCFIVGAVPTIIAVYLYGNILDMSGEQMMDTKEKMTLPFLGQFAYWLPASIIVACKKNSTKYILISLFFSVLVAIMTVTKTGMLMAIIFFVIGVTAFNPDIIQHKAIKVLKKSAVLWLPVLIFAYFSYNNTIRNDATSTTDMAYIEYSNSSYVNQTDNAAQSAFLNYLYYCSPWSNLDYNISHQTKRGYGVNTIYPFTRLLRIDIPRVPLLEPYFLNTHSFITDYYVDFGCIGAVIMSFLIGFFIYFCYSKFGLSDDPLLLSFYVIIAYGTVMMFFSNHFNNGYQLNYFISMVGYSAIFRRKAGI